jgi:hypothetical protein
VLLDDQAVLCSRGEFLLEENVRGVENTDDRSDRGLLREH